MSVTLVHRAKAVGRNEMPFGRGTRVTPCNIVGVYSTAAQSKFALQDCGQSDIGVAALAPSAKRLALATYLYYKRRTVPFRA